MESLIVEEVSNINEKFLSGIRKISHNISSLKQQCMEIFHKNTCVIEEDIGKLENVLETIIKLAKKNQMSVYQMVKWTKFLENSMKDCQKFLSYFYCSSNRDKLKVLEESLLDVDNAIEELGEFLISTKSIQDMTLLFLEEYQQMHHKSEYQVEDAYLEDKIKSMLKNTELNFTLFNVDAYECRIEKYYYTGNKVLGIGLLDNELCKIYLDIEKKEIICESASKNFVFKKSGFTRLRVQKVLPKGSVRETVKAIIYRYF